MRSGRGTPDVATQSWHNLLAERAQATRAEASAGRQRSASAPAPQQRAARAVSEAEHNVWADAAELAHAFASLGPISLRAVGERLPRPGANGTWSGRVGDGAWHPHKEAVAATTGGRPVQFYRGYPDFSPWAALTCSFDGLTGGAADFTRADDVLRAHLALPNRSAASAWRRVHGYTWHHHEDARTLQLVPRLLHANVAHAGGASLARRGQAAEPNLFAAAWERGPGLVVRNGYASPPPSDRRE